MATTEINGVELHHESTGTGPCLVLTHGSWTDATSWDRAVARLCGRYRVVVWDRRGHSRSADGPGTGSRATDTADLAALIEHVSDGPVHVVGNSYGASITLTLLTTRPDLVATASVHEPPLFGLIEGTRDETVQAELESAAAEIAVVAELIGAGADRAAAEHFVDEVALGAGAWARLPDDLRTVMEANAATYLDELGDETAMSVDAAALAATDVPVHLTLGTQRPVLFAPVTAELRMLLPHAIVDVLDGAGHIPHATHTELWADRLVGFHDQVGLRPAPSRR